MCEYLLVMLDIKGLFMDVPVGNGTRGNGTKNMKYYRFIAKDRVGRKYEGRFQAETEEKAEAELHRRGYYVTSLKEETGDEEPLGTGNAGPGNNGKKIFGLPLQQVMTYGIPMVAVFIALSGIYITFRMLRTEPPSNTPEDIVTAYFSAEQSGNFKSQYDLFSRGRAGFYGDALRYEKIRRGLSVDGVFSGVPLKVKVSAIEFPEISREKARVKVRGLRPTGLVDLEFLLVVQEGQWKINYFRDPQVVESYLARIEEKGGYESGREVIRDLKMETGLSDLEIKDELRSYRLKQY